MGRPPTLETNPPEWANKVDELLEAQHKTRQWLAGEIGVSPSTLTRHLNGSLVCSPARRGHIAQALGIPPHWLLDADQKSSGAPDAAA